MSALSAHLLVGRLFVPDPCCARQPRLCITLRDTCHVGHFVQLQLGRRQLLQAATDLKLRRETIREQLPLGALQQFLSYLLDQRVNKRRECDAQTRVRVLSGRRRHTDGVTPSLTSLSKPQSAQCICTNCARLYLYVCKKQSASSRMQTSHALQRLGWFSWLLCTYRSAHSKQCTPAHSEFGHQAKCSATIAVKVVELFAVILPAFSQHQQEAFMDI